MIAYVFNKSRYSIAGYVRAMGATVWTSARDVPATIVQAGQFNLLEQVDVVILEIAHPADELLYILAQAIILRKPTLCLYPEDREPTEIIQHLSKKTVPSTIIKKAYQATTIEDIVRRFLAKVDASIVIDDIPHIKFTLRLTPTLERYLDWLHQQQNINKAELIRFLLKQNLDNNQDYQDYLREH